MEILASAPCKIILFGEHYVVYGAPALSLPISPLNKVRLVLSEKGSNLKKRILLYSSLGKGAISSDGSYFGDLRLSIYAEVAKEVAKSYPFPSCKAYFMPCWNLKGTGISASLCSAFAAGLICASSVSKPKASRQSCKSPDPEKIFRAAQAGDYIAHAKKASGIDAKTVSIGKPLVFMRSFNPPSFESKPFDFKLPKSASLILIDTSIEGKESTEAMLRKFASSFQLNCLPEELADGKRKEIIEEYLQIWKQAEKALKEKNAPLIGKLMDENHFLLKAKGVSSNGIDRAAECARAYGAYGAKLTGAGGKGGAVVAILPSKAARQIAQKIHEETGFLCRSVQISKQGAKAKAIRLSPK